MTLYIAGNTSQDSLPLLSYKFCFSFASSCLFFYKRCLCSQSLPLAHPSLSLYSSSHRHTFTVIHSISLTSLNSYTASHYRTYNTVTQCLHPLHFTPPPLGYRPQCTSAFIRFSPPLESTIWKKKSFAANGCLFKALSVTDFG